MNEAVLGQLEAAARALDTACDDFNSAATDMETKSPAVAVNHATVLCWAADAHRWATDLRYLTHQVRTRSAQPASGPAGEEG